MRGRSKQDELLQAICLSLLKRYEYMGTLSEIESVLSLLTKAERKVAQYVVQNPGQIKGCSITELAKRSGVSETTVLKFCRALNYRGYRDFKIALAEELATRLPAGILSNMYSDIDINDRIDTVVKKVFQNNIKALHDTLKHLDRKQMEKAILAVSNANRIYFYGNGSSAVIASSAYYKLLRSGIISHIFEETYSQRVSLATLKADDAVIGISYSGTTEGALNALKKAREVGATAICVTNFPNSPLGQVADITLSSSLRMGVSDTEVISARIAQLGIIDVLCIGVILKKSGIT